jgi:hypothetical protein
VTVRELIRAHVYQAVREWRAHQAWQPRPAEASAVTPTEAERLLNGPPRARANADWTQEYARALHAFERRAFLVLVNDQQVDDLDITLELRPETQVTFLRLLPLAGG